MFKNTASQKIRLFAFDYSTGAPKTGDAANLTAYLSKDYGTLSALTDTSATEISSTNAPGWYVFDVSQTETNADDLQFTGKSATSNVVLVGRSVRTLPANFGALSIDTNGWVKIQTGLKTNVGFTLPFVMRDTNGAPLTGSTVSVYRAIDGATSFTLVGTATEKSAGWYHIALANGDVNGTSIALRMTGSSGSGTPVDNAMTLVMEP